jgi:hypothetical protein
MKAELMPDTHTAMMFQWRKQVRSDREGLTRFDFEVAYEIAEHVYRDTGWAEFFQGEAASNLGASVRGVQKSLYRIASRGHLEIEDNSKAGRPNRYRPIIWALETEQKPAETTSLETPERGGYERRSYPSPAPQFAPGTNGRSGGVRTAVRTKHLTSSESSYSDRHGRDLQPDFDEWYAVYPKHKAKGEAERAYSRARSKGATAEVLIAGARRYAVERAGQDPKYTKHPATWLNAKCWLDPPEGTTVPVAKSPGPSPTNLSIAERMAAAVKQARAAG